MSVKEKAKAFEDRHSVVGESPPPRKKSREELIENRDDGDTLGEHTTGTPVPPPRKYKKNGTTRANEKSSPSTERKENMEPELNTANPTRDSDSTTSRKPPRPPPPPRGSSLGRKSTLLSNAQPLPPGDKKKKPPVPPKPKNYVPKKVSLPNPVRVKSDNSSICQPANEGAGSASRSSTASDKHKSQFFLVLEKGNYTVAPSKGHDSKTASNVFVSPEENNGGLKSKEIESKGKGLSNKGINNVRNGVTDISMHENEVASQHGKTILPEKIISGKNKPDPLEGLEITVDEFSDEEGNLSPVVLKDEKEHNSFADLVEVNGITNGLTGHGKQNVKILYSFELEEECSVTRLHDSAERQKLDDVSLDKPAHASEAEEVSKSRISMDDQFVQRREETPDENSLEGGDVEESYHSEPSTRDTSEEGHKRVEIIDSNDINQKIEKFEKLELEKPTDDEEMCDIDILDDLSDDNEENISEGDVSIDEFYKTTMDDDVELEADLQLGDLDSRPVEPMVESKEDRDHTVTELQDDEPQENSKVILAEAIREGMLISVTDHVVSEGAAEVVEEESHEVLANEDSEGLEDELVKEELEITASFSQNEQVVQNTDHSEHSMDDFRNETEGQLASDVATTFSAEVESENVIMSALNEEEILDENLLQDSVSEDAGKEEDTVHITETSCSSGNEERIEVDSEVAASVAEPTLLETSKEVVEFIVNAVTVSTEDEEKANNVAAPSTEEPASEEDKTAEEAHSPTSTEPVRPERRSRQARQQKNVYENIDPSKNQPLELIKSGTAVRKTQSFSKYETVVLSLPRPVQRVSDDEAIYRVPRAIPVESYADDESEYSVPYQVSSRRTVQDNDYAVPKPIIVQASAVRDRSKSNEGDVYSVPGQVTSVPVVETFPEPSCNELAQAVAQDADDMYAIPVQGQKSISVVHVPAEERQEKTVTVFPVPAEEAQQRKGTPPPKPPRWSLTKDEMKINVDLGSVPSSASAETAARESPKPAPRTREQRNSPTPVPRNSSKTAESSESATPPKSESPVPAPRSRLNALQISRESSSEISTLSSSEVSTQESTEEESTIKRRPPRPPPPTGRASFLNNGNIPPVSPGPFGHDLDSDSDSDVGEETPAKGPSKPKTYYIAHEILTTERTFVDALKLVFEECYGTIKNANVIADAVLADIFRDLENIYLLDSKFLQELEERMKTWEEHERIGDIIKKYGHFLKMYTQYVNGYDKAMSVFQDTMKENTEFATLVSQFQASERCNGMILSAYMLKPVQRIPSYRLLLIDYLKHLPKDSEESKDTEITLKIVSEVATHINESMKKMDSFEQMLKLQRMLVGHPEIVKAGRDYLKEGTLMKLCRKDMQERMFFLLTDVLLYTTPVGGNQYKLNKTLPLLGMQVLVSDSPDFVNEFSIISTTRSFTLTASTPEERDQWVEAINDAIEVVTKRKITFVSKTRDAAALGIQEQDGDFKLGEKAPVWIPDARVTMCMSCTSPFTLTNRRHHCRACGNVVCGSCSDSTAPLVYLDYTQARVCDKCYDLLLKDFHTDEIHVVEEEVAALPPLLQEVENAEKLLRKPTKFEIMRRFKSKKTKRKSQIMHPSHLTEVVANQEGSQMSGYLRFKKGRHGWKKAWFVLKNNVLYSYKASSDVVALETLPVLGYQIEDLGKEGDDFVFQLKHQGVPPLVFKADNETSGKRWLEELKKAITMET